MQNHKVKRILKGEAICKNCIFYSEEFRHCTNSDYILQEAKNNGSIFIPSTLAVNENHYCKYFTDFTDLNNLEPAIIDRYKEFVEAKDKYFRKTFN